MIHLCPIRTDHPSYLFVETLFLSAFPEDERRDIDAQRRNVDFNPLFHCCLVEAEQCPVGFFTYWDFQTFCYVEHFAIASHCRNKTYGQQVIRAVLEEIKRPLVLEVELPSDEISRRRIGFYQRQGFVLWKEYPYIQPSYREGGNTLPMHLMATSGLNPDRDFEMVKERLYREVYCK